MSESLESCAWVPGDGGSRRDWEISDAVCWLSIVNWHELVYIILAVDESDFANIVEIESSSPNSLHLILSESRRLIGNLVDERVKRYFFSIIVCSFVIQVFNLSRIITKDILTDWKGQLSSSECELLGHRSHNSKKGGKVATVLITDCI
jgi:hypothetical protein